MQMGKEHKRELLLQHLIPAMCLEHSHILSLQNPNTQRFNASVSILVCNTLFVHVHQEDMFKFSEVEGKAVSYSISPQSETLWTPSKGKNTRSTCGKPHRGSKELGRSAYTDTQNPCHMQDTQGMILLVYSRKRQTYTCTMRLPTGTQYPSLLPRREETRCRETEVTNFIRVVPVFKASILLCHLGH